MKQITFHLLHIASLFFCTTLLHAQNVGIGTTLPYAPLHVKTNGFEVMRLEGSTIPSMSMYDNGTYRGSLIARAADFELYSPLPIMMAPGFTTTATFLPNGHVGIGITSPSERLHVIHTADVNKNAIYGYASQTSGSTDFQNTGVTGFGQGNGAAGGFGFGFGVKGIGSLNSYGAVGVYAGLGTTIPQNNLIGGSFYSLYSDVGTPAANRYAGVFLNGNVGIGNSNPAYKLDVTGNTNIAGTLRTTGNVGIGNTPFYPLDVVGDANITGALRTNGNAGTSGQVLTSNGTGAPSWTASNTGTTALYNNMVNLNMTSNVLLTSVARSSYIPGFDYNCNVATNSKAIISFCTYLSTILCAACANSLYILNIVVDGAPSYSSVVAYPFYYVSVPNGTGLSYTATAFVSLVPGAHNIKIGVGLVDGPPNANVLQSPYSYMNVTLVTQ